MNVYVKGYARNNLGDDLFFKILFERYEDVNYIINYNRRNPSIKEYKNVKKISARPYIALEKIFNTKIPYQKKFENKSDIVVEIGGSLFIQKENVDRINIEKPSKKYYILGCNIGPFYQKEYLEYIKENVLKYAEDVCVRDKKSYELCKDLKNVRVASDIVFGLDVSDIKITNSKKVVISVINCKNKDNEKFKEVYENKICELVTFFDNKGYDIVLMSYCKAEADEEAIQSILNRILNNDIKNKIKRYYYNGNIKEALDVMGDSQIIVGSRFHANILGLIMDKTIIPIAYSDKTINVLKDMDFKGKIFDVRDLEKFNVASITEEDLNYKLDVSFQKKDAEEHFKELDKILKRKEKYE